MPNDIESAARALEAASEHLQEAGDELAEASTRVDSIRADAKAGNPTKATDLAEAQAAAELAALRVDFCKARHAEASAAHRRSIDHETALAYVERLPVLTREVHDAASRARVAIEDLEQKARERDQLLHSIPGNLDTPLVGVEPQGIRVGGVLERGISIATANTLALHAGGAIRRLGMAHGGQLEDLARTGPRLDSFGSLS